MRTGGPRRARNRGSGAAGHHAGPLRGVLPVPAPSERVHAVEVSTVVRAPRREVYDFLLDFTGYADYSEYVEGVERDGDGGPGTEYAITVSWWKLRHTATSEVTATDPPDRIDWRLLGGLDARGHWRIESAADAAVPDGSVAERTPGQTADRSDDPPRHRVVLRIEYDLDSVEDSSLSLPALVPVQVVVDRVAPRLQSAAESIVEDVVADLEGTRREVTVTVEERPERE